MKKNLYAIVKSGHREYKLTPGKSMRYAPLEAGPGDPYQFSQIVKVVVGDQVIVGDPCIEGACVRATVVGDERERGTIIFRLKRRIQYHRKSKHRLRYTRLKINEIAVGDAVFKIDDIDPRKLKRLEAAMKKAVRSPDHHSAIKADTLPSAAIFSSESAGKSVAEPVKTPPAKVAEISTHGSVPKPVINDVTATVSATGKKVLAESNVPVTTTPAQVEPKPVNSPGVKSGHKEVAEVSPASASNTATDAGLARVRVKTPTPRDATKSINGPGEELRSKATTEAVPASGKKAEARNDATPPPLKTAPTAAAARPEKDTVAVPTSKTPAEPVLVSGKNGVADTKTAVSSEPAHEAISGTAPAIAVASSVPAAAPSRATAQTSGENILGSAPARESAAVPARAIDAARAKHKDVTPAKTVAANASPYSQQSDGKSGRARALLALVAALMVIGILGLWWHQEPTATPAPMALSKSDLMETPLRDTLSAESPNSPIQPPD